MKKILFLLLSLFFFELSAQDIFTERKSLILMGCAFEITAVDSDQANAWNAINGGIKEIQRIENMISSWKDDSQTSKINRNAGQKPVVVDQELFDLIYRAKKVSHLTEGAFDISFASMDKIWTFDGTEIIPPNRDKIERAISKIDWQKIELNPHELTVFLQEDGMRISFGAIGKGYAANKALALMKTYNIQGALVNASGDLIAWGNSGKEDPWKVMISDPSNPKRALAWLSIQDQAVVTSGNYEKFLIMDGKKYSHIIDPRNGYPVSGLKSVTVICPDAEFADALATSIFVLGAKKGIEKLNQLKNVEGILITDSDEMLYSKNLELNLLP
jgi:thiamine biosynthesis lipoprotein